MASVGLCVITEEYTKELHRKLLDLTPHVDDIYVQVNGPRGGGTVPGYRIHFSKFEWNNNFADARNALLAEVKTDFWLWLDTDDELIGAEHIRSTVDHMAETGVDIMYAPYEYDIQNGVVTEVQNRERIIRTSLPGKWHGAIHETWIPEQGATRETTTKLVWRHHKTKDEHKASMLRNRAILEAERAKGDPRIAYYLGLNYGMDDHYREAIECFQELIKTGGWDEERYRAWLQIFSCYFELGEHVNALNAALQATLELPEWPDAYLMLQQLYYETDDHTKSLEWYHVGRSKPMPDSDSAFNPIVRVYQPMWLAAYSYLATGQPRKALEVAMQATKACPPLAAQWEELRKGIVQAVNEAGAIDNAKALIQFAEKYDGDATKVLDALPASLRADIRLTDERRRLIPGKTWPKGSVVFYCGPSYEPWGPDTLDKGMGGSEEAVVYLARELAKEGRQVFVYNERTTPHLDIHDPDGAYQTVAYYPWTEINPNDDFDVFVAWRTPVGLKDIKARLKLCDVHDIISPEVVYENLPYVDKYLFKSKFHRELYPEVPDSKAVVIGNGLSKDQFK